MEHARGRDDGVEPAEAFDRTLDERLDLSAVGHVRRDGKPAKLLGELFERLCPPCRERHAEAVLGERARDGLADPLEAPVTSAARSLTRAPRHEAPA